MSEHASKAAIGIDKLTLYDLKCVDIKREILDAEESKERVTHSSFPVEASSTAKMIEHIRIIDNHRFADLEIKKVIVPKKGLKTYVDLALTVHHIVGSNLNNLSLDEYKCELVAIRDYINDVYGILLDFRFAKVKYMEINCTFPLNHPFREYDRVLRLMYHVIPGREKLGKLNTVEAKTLNKEETETETYSRGTSQTEIVVYNKTREMLKHDACCDVPENLIRFEVRLLTAKKINQAFGSMRLADITDDMVADYFYGKMCDIDRGFKAWEEKNKKKLKKLVDEFRRPHEQWQLKLITHCLNEEIKGHLPLLLDIEDLKNAIDQDKYNHRARSLKAIDKHEKTATVLYRDDRRKEPEIISKIDDAYRKSIYPDDGV